jgi:flavin reductase (DIM6/NTAB) family NADH-FMN oxidoreductase RutF
MHEQLSTPTNPISPLLIEHGDPCVDGRAFRRCLGQYPTGVTVITARMGERLLGMAVNSFAAVSLDPPLVLWSIRRESSSAADFCEARHFGVSVLASDQVQVSQWFGSANPERFTLAGWTPDTHGTPLLNGAVAHLECRRETILDGGDHLILVLRVERYARYKGEPLLFAQGQYAVSQTHPNLAKTPAADTPTAPLDETGPSFLRLLSIANQRMSAQFQEHREALGVNASSTRVLNSLAGGPCAQQELEQITYLGREHVEDTLADLMARGDVARSVCGRYELTPHGREKSAAVAQRSVAFTQAKLEGIPAPDIEAARRVLVQLHTR